MGFGPKIVGAAAYAKTVAVKKGKAGFGPRVTGVVGQIAPAAGAASPATRPTDAIAPNVPVAAEGVSVEQVRAILAENPAFLEPLHVAELERTEGPRREALLALKETALATGNSDIAAEIVGLLKDMLEVPAAVTEPPTDLAALEFNALKRLAKEKGVDMNKNRSRADITAALEEILTAPAA